MNIEIDDKKINEHIEKVHTLLKQQNYIPTATSLTAQERDKLYKLLFSYNEYGVEECVFGRYHYLKTQEDVDKLNEKLLESMDEEARFIIEKCGVNPKKVFSVDKSHCIINKQLLNSMKACSIAKVGDYIIELDQSHPIDKESPEIKSFREEVQKEKLEKYKNGEATFRVLYEINGEEETIYYHSEDLHFGGYVSFMGEQIGGNFGIRGYSFSSSSGMMKMFEGRDNSLNNLMPFFESFENLLSKEIILGFPSSKQNEDVQEKPRTM